MKHLILNSNRLRTFDDARLEVVTCVEAKLGLRIRYSKPSDTGSRGHSDPTAVDAANSRSFGMGKQSKSWSKNEGKGTSKDDKGIPKESSKEPKVPKARTKVKHRTLVSQNLKIRNQRQARKLRHLHRPALSLTSLLLSPDTSWNDGWTCDEWNDGWSFDEWNDELSSIGWHEGWETNV